MGAKHPEGLTRPPGSCQRDSAGALPATIEKSRLFPAISWAVSGVSRGCVISWGLSPKLLLSLLVLGERDTALSRNPVDLSARGKPLQPGGG